MVSEWKEVTLGELGSFKNGANYNQSSYGSDYPVISVKNLFRGRFATTDGLDAIKAGVIKRVDDYLLEKGDILFARSSVKRSGAGQVAIVGDIANNIIFSGFTIRFRIFDKAEVNPLFLLYLFKTPKYRELFTRIATGTTISNLSQATLAKVPVHLPPKPYQDKIAEIVDSLDTKSELNAETNQTLEKMAQALFKSWFVDFDPVIDNALAAGNTIPETLQKRAEQRQALRASDDAPAPLPEAIHQRFPASFVFDAEMGWIPEGWEVQQIGKVIENVGGGTPRTKEDAFWVDGTHAFCTPKDMSLLTSKALLGTERHLTDAGVAKISSGQLPEGTVLMSSRAPIGYLAINDIPVSVNQGVIAMKPNDAFSSEYLLSWAEANMEEVVSRANGSTFLEISKKNFREIPFLMPNEAVLNQYDKIAKPYFQRIVSIQKEVNQLAKLRDTLLPKLISGELRIPEAQQQTEAAVA